MLQQPAYRKIMHLALFMLGILPHAVPVSAHAPGDVDILPLKLFVQDVMNGDPDDLRGLYVPGVLADTIVEQPEGMPAYVSSENEVLTRFEMAEEFGTFGLLAHNYLAGEDFHKLEQGQKIFLVYGDGKTETYVARHILRYQALSPQSVTSDFIDLQTDERLSASELFLLMFNRPGSVVLQTCIDAEGNASWGRLFVIAVPIEEHVPLSMPWSPIFQ